ncbi:MAG TPA: metallophosphoesterase [Candidatus Binataceae bacterium]|jgi:Icc-related predicted phosphoesterase|nr:metallophosphoesterase [Candidatus Binataceae bacterium]
MKIVSIGDIHMATGNLARLAQVLRSADLMILAGDLTNFGGVEDSRKVLEAVSEYCQRVLAVPGNVDQREVFPFLEEAGVALHGRGVVIDGVAIFGCGGSNLTPFHTPSELSEAEIEQTLRRGYGEVGERRPLVMVCHAPPLRTRCDRLRDGTAVGSAAARRLIEEVQPEVCISGHIHESAGRDLIGRTPVLNAGAFRDGGYIVVETRGLDVAARLEFL